MPCTSCAGTHAVPPSGVPTCVPAEAANLNVTSHTHTVMQELQTTTETYRSTERYTLAGSLLDHFVLCTLIRVVRTAAFASHGLRWEHPALESPLARGARSHVSSNSDSAPVLPFTPACPAGRVSSAPGKLAGCTLEQLSHIGRDDPVAQWVERLTVVFPPALAGRRHAGVCAWRRRVPPFLLRPVSVGRHGWSSLAIAPAEQTVLLPAHGRDAIQRWQDTACIPSGRGVCDFADTPELRAATVRGRRG